MYHLSMYIDKCPPVHCPPVQYTHLKYRITHLQVHRTTGTLECTVTGVHWKWNVPVDIMYRWSECTGDHNVPVVTGGHNVPVVRMLPVAVC